MKLQNTLLTAIKALEKNKLRSGLTSIGIIIGVSSVIIMIGLGRSTQVVVRQKVFSYGANALKVGVEKQFLTAQHIMDLKKNYYQIKYISPIYEQWVMVKHKNKSLNTNLLGINDDYFKMKDWKIKSGRSITDDDLAAYSKVAVIGKTVKDILFNYENPIGKQIIMNDIPLKIIGILAEKGKSFSNKDFDNLVTIPYSTAGIRIHNTHYCKSFYLATHSESMVTQTIRILEKYLRKKQSIPPRKRNNFWITTSKQKLKIANDISKYLSILIAGIASISLFVGGVGIMNIMLVSVTERTREIGIRMAVGANKKDIMIQFLAESIALCLVGGVMGILFGLIIYYTIIYILNWPFIFSLFSVFVSFLFSTMVGIFFGYYPSKKASELNPIEALRYE